MGRALLNNLRGGPTQGGSTLTQQYVERYYVDQTTTDYYGKFKETLLAIKIARQESKPEILGRYLNTIYFGRDSYGIQAAAQAYFGVDAADLTVSQAAMLAGIIPSPNNWDPAVSPEKAAARWQIVLDAMLADGWITQAEHDAATFPTTVPYVRAAKYAGPQGYLLRMVEDELASKLDIDKEQLDRNGYTIVTTIQKPVQTEIERSAADLLAGTLTDGETPPDANLDVAMASVDPVNGGVVALYGGEDFLTDQVNRATYGNGVQAGSTFKPFTLVAGLEQGIPLTTRYNGHSPQQPDGWDTPVSNFGNKSYGTIDLVEATAQSVNTVYAQLNTEVGPEATVAAANDAGISTPIPSVPSNVLGVASVRPLDMAGAYATFAAQGMRSEVHIVASVTNSDDTTAYEVVAARTKRSSRTSWRTRPTR